MGIKDRSSPRFSRQLAVNVNGLEIVTTNVAIGGVQLCCPDMRYAGLDQAQRDEKISLKLRIPGTSTWVAVNGHTRYANFSEDEYLVGYQFGEFVDDQASDWAGYISTLAKPIA
ncbi:MAG: hypothetical protein ACI9BW_003848 [Gammaproteobacteria bacterium]|jgi:hypothetical protein